MKYRLNGWVVLAGILCLLAGSVSSAMAQAIVEGAETAEAESLADAIGEHLTVSGAVEVEAVWSEDYEGASESNVELATADFAFEARLDEWATGTLALTWDGDDDKVGVDEAFITVGNEDFPVSLQAGRFVVPFGVYESSTLSNPLTKEAFETGEDPVMLSTDINGLFTQLYVFNGDTNEGGGDDTIEHFGVNIGYGMEQENFSVNTSVGYINSIADADGLSDFLGEAHPDAMEADYTDGLAVSAVFGAGPFTLIGEYITALEALDGTDIEPKAFQVEADYGLEVNGKELVLALNYSQTEDLAEACPESRIAVAAGMGISEGLGVTIEYAQDEDYDEADGGTGETANTFTTQLAYEF